jgi:hypothetical protein
MLENTIKDDYFYDILVDSLKQHKKIKEEIML